MDTSSRRKTDAFDFYDDGEDGDDDDDDVRVFCWSYVHGEFHVSDHSFGSDHSELELDFFFEYYLCTNARVHILKSKTLEF